MTQPPSGEYVLFDTTITGSGGRLSCTIAEEKKLPVGIYPVKLVVRYVTRQLNKQQKPTKLTRAFVLFLPFINIFTKYQCIRQEIQGKPIRLLTECQK